MALKNIKVNDASILTIDEIPDYNENLVQSKGIKMQLEQKLKDTNNFAFDTPDDELKVIDNHGNIIVKIDDHGLNDPNIYPQYSDSFEIVDKNGYIIFKADKDGIDYPYKTNPIVIENTKQLDLIADVNMCIAYGQSLAVAGSLTVPGMNKNLQFQNGIQIPYSAEQAADPQYVANYYGNSFSNCADSGFSGTIKHFMKMWEILLNNENNIDILSAENRFIGICPGISGSAISGLIKGTYAYTRTIQAVQAAKRIAAKDNKSFAVMSMFWIQGESDYSTATLTSYYNTLWQMFQDFNTDIKAITNQTNDVQFICYNPASHTESWAVSSLNATDNVTMAMLKLSQDQPNVHTCPAMYQFKYSDQLHLMTDCYGMMGAMAAVVAKRTISDRNKPNPILPREIITNSEEDGSYMIEMKMYCDNPPLVFDTTGSSSNLFNNHGQQTNYGFSLESIFNVTEYMPLAGNKVYYTKENAISTVPLCSRKLNRVIKYQQNANTWITIEFVSGNPLNETDWNNVSNWQSSNQTSQELITNVRLSRSNSIVMKLSGNPQGLVLNYAKTGRNGGGNLRDSQGDSIKIEISGSSYPVHNFAPIFKVVIE